MFPWPRVRRLRPTLELPRATLDLLAGAGFSESVRPLSRSTEPFRLFLGAAAGFWGDRERGRGGDDMAGA